MTYSKLYVFANKKWNSNTYAHFLVKTYSDQFQTKSLFYELVLVSSQQVSSKPQPLSELIFVRSKQDYSLT